MKKIGIIAEYNPFHNGHLYQINKIKQELNPETIIIAMSQDIVQRGSFASFDKWWRAEKALDAGADLIIGLPFYASSQSASYFAQGAIKLLNKIGIDTLSFGSEKNDINLLNKTVDLLIKNEEEITQLIKKYLKEGKSYPRSKELALNKFINTDPILFKPNNILALEYLIAIRKNNYPITPFSIERIGNDYHSLNLDNQFSSASGIRKALEKSEIIEGKTPYSYSELYNHYSNFDESAFFKSLMTKLITTSTEKLEQIVGINEDRANQLINLTRSAKSFEEINKMLKSKNITQTAINRMILNLMLEFKKNDFNTFISPDYDPYVRVLGFNENGQRYLKNLESPVITTFNKGIKTLNNSQKKSIEYDKKAAQLRSIFLNTGTLNKDYTQKIIKK